MNRLLFWLVILFAIIGILYMLGTFGRSTTGKITLNNKTYNIEVSDTGVKRELGLSLRKSLCADCGMLFEFEKDDQYAIWMKDMNFDIDVVYFDSLMNIVDVKENFSKDSFPEKYINKVIAKYALEINAGEYAKSGAQIGEKVILNIDNK